MKSKRAAIEDAAAAWIGRCDGGLSDEVKTEFSVWIAADPRHAEAFERMNAISLVLNKLSALRPAEGAHPESDLRLRRSQGKLIWLVPALAVAAALCAAYLGEWRPTPKALLFSLEATTEIGALKEIALPDGSVVEMNTDSAVEIRFAPGERHVRLVRGEAHFKVAKNPERPFVVEVHDVAVRAVGTAFDISLRKGSVEVLVTEGRVRVSDIQRGTSLITSTKSQSASPAKPSELAAGQLAVISFAPGQGALAPVTAAALAQGKISQLLSWEEQKLDFDPTPLGTLVDEFNRYNRHKLVVADPAIADLKVGGTFRVTDYDAFVRLLESSFGVTAERTENETVLRARQ